MWLTSYLVIVSEQASGASRRAKLRQRRMPTVEAPLRALRTRDALLTFGVLESKLCLCFAACVYGGFALGCHNTSCVSLFVLQRALHGGVCFVSLPRNAAQASASCEARAERAGALATRPRAERALRTTRRPGCALVVKTQNQNKRDTTRFKRGRQQKPGTSWASLALLSSSCRSST